MLGGKNNEIFVLLSAAVAIATLWNIRENHKIRKLQKKELEEKLEEKEFKKRLINN